MMLFMKYVAIVSKVAVRGIHRQYEYGLDRVDFTPG